MGFPLRHPAISVLMDNDGKSVELLSWKYAESEREIAHVIKKGELLESRPRKRKKLSEV